MTIPRNRKEVLPVAALTAAMILVLCVSAFSQPASVECSVMSNSVPENTLYHRLHRIAEQQKRPTLMQRIIAEQMRLGLTSNNVLNINAMDVLDPVHGRIARERKTENHYDGDQGREYADHLRDNGHGARGASLGSFVQIGDALPVIEAPSIVPDDASEAQQVQHTLDTLQKVQRDG
jgi:hypothetical protein